MSTKSSISYENGFEAKTGELTDNGWGKPVTGIYDWHVYNDVLEDDAIFFSVTGPAVGGIDDSQEVFMRLPKTVCAQIVADLARHLMDVPRK